MRAAFSDSVMSGLSARIDEMNALADQSPGFIWRLRGEEATAENLHVFADYYPSFDTSRFFYNMSVWENVEALKQYAFKTRHAEMLKNKDHWIDHFENPHLALWWIPAGHVPTIAESAARLRAVSERGPTEFAFTFARTFPIPKDA